VKWGGGEAEVDEVEMVEWAFNAEL